MGAHPVEVQVQVERNRQARHRRRRKWAFFAVLVTVLGVGIPIVGAAVSQVTQLTVCSWPDGHSTRMNPYTGDCPKGSQEVGWNVHAIGSTTTTKPPATTTTTTQPSSGTIVPAGGACPRDPSSGASHYEGNRLTETQAVQALWQGGFRTVADLRAFVAIGKAESSLCVRTWHYHPDQSCPGFTQPCADRGWLQINDHFWPQYPDAQVLDPVGAAKAAHSIVYEHGGSYGTWDTAGTISANQPSAAFVCSIQPTATGC